MLELEKQDRAGVPSRPLCLEKNTMADSIQNTIVTTQTAT